MPKKRFSPGFIAPPLHLLPDGELVGRWNAPASYPAISPTFARAFASGGVAFSPDEPDDDALELERAVLALARDPPAVEGGAELAAWGIGDAGQVATAVLSRARRNLAGLVLGYGAIGSRPDWEHEPFRVMAVAARNGRVGVFRVGQVTMPTLDGGQETVEGEIRCEATRRGDYPNGAYCRLNYEPDPRRVMLDRADYLIWRCALSALARNLSGRLKRFEPVEPEAPWAPWVAKGDSP